jgi:cytochrome c oxidase cbb3-type subunit 2
MTAHRDKGLPWRGILLVFLTYFYFLLFTQFTFLELLNGALEEEQLLKSILASMAIAGIAGSFVAIAWRRFIRKGPVILLLLIGCAVVSLLSPFLHGGGLAFGLTAAAMGFMMGLLTVSVASLLPMLAPFGMRGRVVGIGTGLAYALCNLPAVFSTSANFRSFLCTIVLIAGWIVLWKAGVLGDKKSASESRHEQSSSGWSTVLVSALVMTFFLLVWFDSAFFYLIQQTRDLKDISWEGSSQLITNAGLHLVAAILSGYLLDRGYGSFVLIAAWLGLAVGAVGLQSTEHSGFTAFYVIGVSLYSVALVFIPSLHAKHAGDRASFIRAALVFSIAGWIGSGLGIGMAENLSRIPGVFILLSALVVFPVITLSRILK